MLIVELKKFSCRKKFLRECNKLIFEGDEIGIVHRIPSFKSLRYFYPVFWCYRDKPVIKSSIMECVETQTIARIHSIRNFHSPRNYVTGNEEFWNRKPRDTALIVIRGKNCFPKKSLVYSNLDQSRPFLPLFRQTFEGYPSTNFDRFMFQFGEN